MSHITFAGMEGRYVYERHCFCCANTKRAGPLVVGSLLESIAPTWPVNYGGPPLVIVASLICQSERFFEQRATPNTASTRGEVVTTAHRSPPSHAQCSSETHPPQDSRRGFRYIAQTLETGSANHRRQQPEQANHRWADSRRVRLRPDA